MPNIIGWDVGGVNVKIANLSLEQGNTQAIKVASRPFEIWRKKGELPEILRSLSAEVSMDTSTETPQTMALTMTAELSDVFKTKREGVLYILQNVSRAFPDARCFVLSLSGEFVPVAIW